MLTAEYDKHPYPSDRVFNVDETGLTVVQTKIPHVIGLKGKRQVGAITSAERGSLVTVICCMSAGGTFVPPMMIFPRKNMTDTLMRGAPPASLGTCHPSGWIQMDLFTEWFHHFLQTTRPSEESPVLLILDGHNTHTRNLQIIDLARKNHVTVVSIRPHTSHKTQPLDKTFMGPLKTYYSLLAMPNRTCCCYWVQSYGDIPTYLQCQTGLVAATGFKVTGIYPCDRTVFKDVDFLPSESSSQTEAIPSPDVNIQSPPSTRLQFSDHSSCASTPAAQNDRDAGIPHNPFRLSDVDLQEAGPSNQPTTYVSARHIMPVPAPKRKTSNRGRKPSSAAVITSSPYKMELEKALNNAKKLPRKGKSKTRQLKPCNRKLEFKEKSDSDSISSVESVMEMPVGEMPAKEDDALCIFEERLFQMMFEGNFGLGAYFVIHGAILCALGVKMSITFVTFASEHFIK
ncbi:DDE superfamily endonuclease [Popillia japonica]|uniref:DDE superfamily endonuclease n=1 Tax=Popillia japonica TaxID=7064 RepID=A0AAW1MBE0_POPJA